jgi:hypothetical protein
VTILVAILFVVLIVVALALFAGLVYLIVRFVNRGDSIAVDPVEREEGSGSEQPPV